MAGTLLGPQARSLDQLIGAYDNLGEPTPLANRPATIYGVTISLQVRLPEAHMLCSSALALPWVLLLTIRDSRDRFW